jgi:hypothetical protein
MFVQVIQGKIADADGLREAVQRWRDTIASDVPGWLGTTGGATADGTAIAVVRFDSEDAARHNSDRPEQQQWWAEASRYFAGDVTFHDCVDTLTFMGGGSDDAGFVQIIQGRTTNADRLRELMGESSDALREYRPEIIGGLVALHGDGGFTQVVYFTSEEAARSGEHREAPADLQALDQEVSSLFTDATFFDLTNPWLWSPRG